MIEPDVINYLKEKAKKPWPFKGIETKIYIANILLFISGISMSISFKSWQHLEGAGSLIVIVGISVAWRDLSGRIEWFEGMVTRSIEKEIMIIKNKDSKGLISSAIDSANEEKLTQFKKSVSELTEVMKYRLRTIEAFTLIIGTFIWGYGSVIGNLVHEFNA